MPFIWLKSNLIQENFVLHTFITKKTMKYFSLQTQLAVKPNPLTDTSEFLGSRLVWEQMVQETAASDKAYN